MPTERLDEPEGNVVTYGAFFLTKTSVIPRRRATFEEWQQALVWCQRVHGAVQFWIGDLLAYGEAEYGDRYVQAVEGTGLAMQTLMNAAYVARHVPPSVRRTTVPYSHHAEVAPLPVVEQERWLDRCQEDGLTRDQLRSHIQQERLAAAGEHIKLLVIVECRDEADQQRVRDQMVAEGRLATCASRARV